MFSQLVLTFTAELLERDVYTHCLQTFPAVWLYLLLSGFCTRHSTGIAFVVTNHLHVAEVRGQLILYDLSAAFHTADHSLL